MDFVKENRVGRVQVSHAIITDNPELVKNAFQDILIVRAEMLYHSFAIEYIGYSPKFDPVPKGNEPPLYQVIMEKNNDGVNIVTFERVKYSV